MHPSRCALEALAPECANILGLGTASNDGGIPIVP